MGIKNKITGEMIDLIVERKQDRTFNYTYQDIQKELLEKFDKVVSINSIRLRYLKKIEQSFKNTNTAVHPKIIQRETIAPTKQKLIINNGLKAIQVTEEEKQNLLEDLKGF